MPRKSRESSGTGIYHVMLRGINRQNIFYDIGDYEAFLLSLRRLSHPEDEFHQALPPHCIVYAYCLMPNHVHLLLQEKDQNPLKAGLVENVSDYNWSSWHEFEGESIICNVKPIFNRMAFEELSALVLEPLPNTLAVLDIDNERKRKTDEEVCKFIVSEFGLRNAQETTLLSREKQREIISTARFFGASIRQIERITGISFSIICRC